MISNFRRTVLYTGITNNLIRGVYEHKNNLATGFSDKYFLHDLLYYEVFDDPNLAIEREKQIKGWSRKKWEDSSVEGSLGMTSDGEH